MERAGVSSFMVVAKTEALLQAGDTLEKEVRCFSFTSRHWHLLLSELLLAVSLLFPAPVFCKLSAPLLSTDFAM